MSAIKLVVLLEQLRTGRGFKSREKFIDGIVDLKQYRRFIAGKSSIPLSVFIQLVERLGIGIEEFFKQVLDLKD